MNAHKVFAAALILAAGLASPGIAAGAATTPAPSTSGQAGAAAIANTVADEHNGALQRGFAKGVRAAGGSETLVNESKSTAAIPARRTARRSHRGSRFAAFRNHSFATEAKMTADLNRNQLMRR